MDSEQFLFRIWCTPYFDLMQDCCRVISVISQTPRVIIERYRLGYVTLDAFKGMLKSFCFID